MQDVKTLQFKTTINCGGCVTAVKPHMDQEKRIMSWKVAIDEPEKILTIQTVGMDVAEIISLVQKAGFQAVLR